MIRPSFNYQRRVNTSLDRALGASRVFSLGLDHPEDRWVLFSDHHRGARDRSDDFARTEQTYHTALGYYIEEGFKLALLGDVEASIGVRLTDSCLMVPNKTVSGVRFPTEHDFRACQVCHREDCPSRSAPFDADLWAAIQPD